MRVSAARAANRAARVASPFDPLAVATLSFLPATAARQRFRFSAPLVLAVVWAAHVLVWVWLDRRLPAQPVSPASVSIEVVMLAAPPPPMIAPPASLRVPAPNPPQAAKASLPRTARQTATTAVLIAPDPVRVPKLFATDGSLLGVEAQVKTLDDRASARATFEYQIAGIAEAETAFELPQMMEVKATRFDRYWKPDANLLDDMLERAVKASTLVVSVPVPGMPGYRIGCAVVIIAASGGCAMSEPKEAVYDIDDPTTLSTAEAQACEVLWERISTARSQDEHRRVRRIYELGCRLPLAAASRAEFR